MRKLLFITASMMALVACKPDAERPTLTSRSTKSSSDSGPSVTMVGPRLGFDGKIRLGVGAPGIGF